MKLEGKVVKTNIVYAHMTFFYFAESTMEVVILILRTRDSVSDCNNVQQSIQ